MAAARIARGLHRLSTGLYEDGIDVRRAVRAHLSSGYTAAYKLDMPAREGQDCTPLRTMCVGGELLLSDREDGVLPIGIGGGDGSVVEDEGPAYAVSRQAENSFSYLHGD
jgi:hypothetical protein